jgi:putative nucleotidyltransferase with HDIG domain
MIHDANLTQVKVRMAEAAVKPQIREIKSGELIAKQGQVLSDSDIVILNAMGITHVTNFPLAINIAYSLFAAFVVFALFLQHFYEKHFYSPQSLGLMFTVAIFACLAADFAGKTSPAFVPIPAEALILTVFFGRGVAFALILITMTFLGLVNVINPIDLIALGVSSFIAIASYVKDRKSLMFRGFSIGLIQGVTFLTVSVLTSSTGISSLEIGPAVVLHIIGGVSSCIIAIGSLPFLENIFGLLTPARIAELTDADQPLLRHLEENAPGTYQHSLAVANLAEAAAKAIHADCNLARAGALYHDIGKMVRPKYFIENQLGDKNPHDGIPPEESRDRVLAHVTDGIALARRYGLPEAIQAFIPQHQGTTLMAYFYHKACLRDGIDNVDAMFYRYPGPKPQNKEAAIVMLADVTEAVTHSMHEPTQEEVEHALDKVFKNRWDDGQFIEAGLSVEEFEKVKQSFGRVWKTLHHERLKYPSTTTGKMPIVPPPDQKQEKEVKISRTLGKDSQESDSEPGKIDVKTKSSRSKKRPK